VQRPRINYKHAHTTGQLDDRLQSTLDGLQALRLTIIGLRYYRIWPEKSQIEKENFVAMSRTTTEVGVHAGSADWL
jgi:hypothetical protein